MAIEREDILNAVVNILSLNLVGVKSVSRVIKDINTYTSIDLPAVTVIGGDEQRNYEGRRMIATFEVIVRVLDKEDGTSKNLETLNGIISQIEKIVEDNPYLDNTSVFPVRITRIETDEGWLFPYTLANIYIETYYSRFEQNRW